MNTEKLNGYRMPAHLQPRVHGWEPLSGPRRQWETDPLDAGMTDLWLAFALYCGAGMVAFGIVVLLLWIAGNFS